MINGGKGTKGIEREKKCPDVHFRKAFSFQKCIFENNCFILMGNCFRKQLFASRNEFSKANFLVASVNTFPEFLCSIRV